MKIHEHQKVGASPGIAHSHTPSLTGGTHNVLKRPVTRTFSNDRLHFENVDPLAEPLTTKHIDSPPRDKGGPELFVAVYPPHPSPGPHPIEALHSMPPRDLGRHLAVGDGGVRHLPREVVPGSRLEVVIVDVPVAGDCAAVPCLAGNGLGRGPRLERLREVAAAQQLLRHLALTIGNPLQLAHSILLSVGYLSSRRVGVHRRAPRLAQVIGLRRTTLLDWAEV